jgi:hypothetical protein
VKTRVELPRFEVSDNAMAGHIGDVAEEDINRVSLEWVLLVVTSFNSLLKKFQILWRQETAGGGGAWNIGFEEVCDGVGQAEQGTSRGVDRYHRLPQAPSAFRQLPSRGASRVL